MILSSSFSYLPRSLVNKSI